MGDQLLQRISLLQGGCPAFPIWWRVEPSFAEKSCQVYACASPAVELTLPALLSGWDSCVGEGGSTCGKTFF